VLAAVISEEERIEKRIARDMANAQMKLLITVSVRCHRDRRNSLCEINFFDAFLVQTTSPLYALEFDSSNNWILLITLLYL
jgi:hypothetical protein